VTHSRVDAEKPGRSAGPVRPLGPENHTKKVTHPALDFVVLSLTRSKQPQLRAPAQSARTTTEYLIQRGGGNGPMKPRQPSR
jgi:hypothetical protein